MMHCLRNFQSLTERLFYFKTTAILETWLIGNALFYYVQNEDDEDLHFEVQKEIMHGKNTFNCNAACSCKMLSQLLAKGCPSKMKEA